MLTKLEEKHHIYLEYKIVMDNIELRDREVSDLVKAIEDDTKTKMLKFSNVYFRPLFGNTRDNQNLIGTKYMFKDSKQYIRFDWDKEGELIKVELYMHKSEAPSHIINVKDKEIDEIVSEISPIINKKLITSKLNEDGEGTGDYFIIQFKDYIKKLKDTVGNNIYDETEIDYNKGNLMYSFRFIPQLRLQTVKNKMAERNLDFDMQKFIDKNLITVEFHKGIKINDDVIYVEIKYFDRYGTEQSVVRPLVKEYIQIKHQLYYYFKKWK